MDRTQIYIRVGVYLIFCRIALFLFATILMWIGGYFVAILLGHLLASIAANEAALKIWGGRKLSDIGLGLSATSARHLGLGLAGGMGAAALTLGPPLAVGAATLAPASGPSGGPATVLFTIAMLLAGSAGEELMFHGYGFQALL